MKEQEIDPAALSMGLLLGVGLPAVMLAILIALCLSACGGSDAAAGPDGPGAAVAGDWAAALPDSAGLVQMSLAGSGAYQVTIEPGGALMERERGAWLLRASRVVFAPATCEAADVAGAPLHLIACGGADSLDVNITGATWPVSFTAGGQLMQLTFHRL